MELNKIYNEDCIETLRKMEGGSLDLIVTSPPYDNLRDYESYIDPQIFHLMYLKLKEGGVVYDPFSGSGTSLKMAHELKRNWIGSEISAEYFELANKRLKPYLDQIKLNL